MPFRFHYRTSARLRSARPVVVVAMVCGPALILPAAAEGQDAVVAAEENFRAQPNGEILGSLDPGTPVSTLGRQGGWTEVAVQGFVFIPSLQVWPDSPLDLVVSAPEGENLRAEPSGSVTGRFEAGTLLEEVRRIPGWIEVRRTGWIWTESLDIDASVVADTATDLPSGVGPEPPSGSGPGDAPEPSTSTGDLLAEAIAGPAPGTPILDAPDGDTLARTVHAPDLRVLAWEGDWARVRIEGWIRLRGASDPSTDPGPPSTVAVGVEDLVGAPDTYRGRLVSLELQFISLEEAERVRPDFYEGEPFLLTRAIGAERRFVYVAVPPERLAEAEDLTPLEDIRVIGRLRAGATSLTGNPIVDLVELERRR